VGLGFSGLATFYADMVSALDAAARWVLCSVGNTAYCRDGKICVMDVLFCAVLPQMYVLVQ
jgi:hypothetical protein